MFPTVTTQATKRQEIYNTSASGYLEDIDKETLDTLASGFEENIHAITLFAKSFTIASNALLSSSLLSSAAVNVLASFGQSIFETGLSVPYFDFNELLSLPRRASGLREDEKLIASPSSTYSIKIKLKHAGKGTTILQGSDEVDLGIRSE